MARIWERTLGVQPIGIRDNFFELGGHSLLAVQLFAEMEQLFGRNLPLPTLFHAPTIEQLANILRSEGRSQPWSSLIPIQPRGSRPPFFCLHTDTGLVFYCRDLAHHLGPDQPVYGLQSLGLDGKRPPFTRFEDMAAHYIKEIRAIQHEGPYYIGGFCLGAYLALELAHQLEEQGQKVALLAAFNTDGAWRLATSIPRELEYHWGNLSRLEAKRRVTYFVERIAYRAYVVGLAAAETTRKLCRTIRRPLPLILRSLHIQNLKRIIL